MHAAIAISTFGACFGEDGNLDWAYNAVGIEFVATFHDGQRWDRVLKDTVSSK